MLVYSGQDSVAPVDVTFKGTSKAFDLYFAFDLAQVCDTFKSTLGLDAVMARVLPELPANRALMIEVVGSNLTYNPPDGEITVNFHICKLRAAYDPGTAIGAESAIYTVERLINLLTANNHFNNHGGLEALRTTNYIAGTDYLPPFALRAEHADQFDGALVQATWAYTQTIPTAL